jgi:hypothetical protein
VNTKNMKLLGFIITAGFVLTLLGYLILDPNSNRKIAAEYNEKNNLSEKQNQKWAVTERFQIRQTNQSLQIEIPHITDLCAENQNLVFKFQAYEIAIAGDHPNIQYSISCVYALSKQQTVFDVSYSDLMSLHQLKQKKLSDAELKSELLYSDETMPLRWNLSEISIEGYSGFKINTFEIQKVFGNNFEFELGN